MHSWKSLRTRSIATVMSAWLIGLATPAPATAQNWMTRVSVDSQGSQGNGVSGWFSRPSISADGRYVAFDSSATNLVAGDTNGKSDVFVRDLITGVTVRVSVDSSGKESNGESYWPSISADGRFVAFQSDADNLVNGDTNGAADVFVHDRDPDGNGIFDEGNGETIRVSVDSGGKEGNDGSFQASISADGALIAFTSRASNLFKSDKNGADDIFVHDRIAGTTIRVSIDSAGTEANGSSGDPAISADGLSIAFQSLASNLVKGDTNGASDVFLRDLVLNTTTRVSVSSTGSQGDSDSIGPLSISADGAVVAFTSFADDLVSGDTNAAFDCFVHDRITGATERVSVDSGGAQGKGVSLNPYLSSDGMLVTFHSDAANLVAADTNLSDDVFVHDRSTGTTTIASANCSGVAGAGASRWATISADGSFVAFVSDAADLVPGDSNGWRDVFVNDRAVPFGNANWINYGSGYSGTNGVIPTLTSRKDPVLGSTVTIDLGNSRRRDTAGVLNIGFDRASVPTSLGGVMLLDVFNSIPLFIPAKGLALSGSLPNDSSLCGVDLLLQALEHDPGATYSVSFTAGLDLVLGH